MSKGFRKRRPRNIPNLKKDVVPHKNITLKEKLHQIYYGTVNLETTCKGQCECCKVAMPQMNYCEFAQIINEIWGTSSKSDKIELICTSIEYFFRNQFEKWGMQSLIKPCMLLSQEGKCKYYTSRPLNCRIYGLWPADTYKARVDAFEVAYEGLLTREQLPLNTQCPNVKRVDESVPLTSDVLNSLFTKLDAVDKKMGEFTEAQIRQKENYRTFSDWLLFKVFGEDFLCTLTDFMIAASKETIMDQITQLKKVASDKFSKDMPNLNINV